MRHGLAEGDRIVPLRGRLGRLAAAVLAVGWIVASGVSTAAAPSTRTVHGELEAVNLTASPNIIVVKVMLPTKEDMIVGAGVGPDVRIARRKKAIALSDLKIGEPVTITYVKDENGLTARSIRVW